MGKKFIPKLCTICSLATVFSVTPALFSCGDKPTPPEPEHEHVLGGYKIDEASHKLYGVCADCGEQFELSDEQFSDIENKVFVKYKGEDKYTLSDTTQNDLTEIVHNAFGSSVDIYLIKGTYMIDETWFVQYHDVEVNIHGILGYHDEKLTTFNCVDSINHPEQ
ncbi:MAG: hypothetical protein MJ201_03040 [Mycoplasmoidaceae bacterium]|nr:hypothetical protein [Mycoplasmoidaceae bacterium]